MATDEAPDTSTPIEELGLSIRVLNLLKINGILTLNALMNADASRIKVRNFGIGALSEVLDKLAARDLQHPAFAAVEQLGLPEQVVGLLRKGRVAHVAQLRNIGNLRLLDIGLSENEIDALHIKLRERKDLL